jgi:CheY-specific phosphatase CheX
MNDLKASIARVVPDVLAGILSEGLGLEGEASQCQSHQASGEDAPMHGAIELVSSEHTVRLGILVEKAIADRLLVALVGPEAADSYNDHDRCDAVAEVANMLAGRLAQALRGAGTDLTMRHPTGSGERTSVGQQTASPSSETWQWITKNRFITINIAFEVR